MKGSGKLLSGVLLGAGAMYVLDPDRGARRRSLIRDQGIRASRKLGKGVGATARDLRNRSAGTAAELASKLKRDRAGDEIVQERVRSPIGRTRLSPTGRLFLGTLGSAAAIAGMKGRGGLGRVLSAIGLGAVAQALLNVPLRRQSRRDRSEGWRARDTEVNEESAHKSSPAVAEASLSPPEQNP